MHYISRIVRVEAEPIISVGTDFFTIGNGTVIEFSRVGINPQQPVNTGDYLITLSPTDRYVCAKDVFERKYEKLEPSNYVGVVGRGNN